MNEEEQNLLDAAIGAENKEIKNQKEAVLDAIDGLKNMLDHFGNYLKQVQEHITFFNLFLLLVCLGVKVVEGQKSPPYHLPGEVDPFTRPQPVSGASHFYPTPATTTHAPSVPSQSTALTVGRAEGRLWAANSVHRRRLLSSRGPTE